MFAFADEISAKISFKWNINLKLISGLSNKKKYEKKFPIYIKLKNIIIKIDNVNLLLILLNLKFKVE